MPLVYFGIYILVGVSVTAVTTHIIKDSFGEEAGPIIFMWPLLIILGIGTLIGRLYNLLAFKIKPSK